MRSRKHHFNTSAAWLFQEAWCTDYAKDRATAGTIEAWRRNKNTLRGAWEAYMYSVLTPITWLALRILLGRQRALRWEWIKPGGYFYTRANNPRKKMRESLRPKRRPVNADDDLNDAEVTYRDAIAQESEGFQNTLAMATLFLAGSITCGDTQPARVPSIKYNPFRRRRKRFRLWSPSITSSLRHLCKIGFLQQPRDEGPSL